MIDVGSAGGDFIEQFDHVPARYSVDLRNPYSSSTVEGITCDFLTWVPPMSFEIAMCLQVIEHVEEAQRFARKLLDTAEIVVVSLPWKWKKGSNKSHIHDPVNADKVLEWFGREPNFSIVVKEVVTDAPRYVAVFDFLEPKWSNLKQRERLLSGSSS
jgi:hypothetical protein